MQKKFTVIGNQVCAGELFLLAIAMDTGLSLFGIMIERQDKRYTSEET